MYCDFVIIVHYVIDHVRCMCVIREGYCDYPWHMLYDFLSVSILFIYHSIHSTTKLINFVFEALEMYENGSECALASANSRYQHGCIGLCCMD